MKSVKKCRAELFRCDDVLACIVAIQRDALLHAAQVCRERVRTGNNIAGCSPESEACAKAIEAEADKLKEGK